ncbi:MAG TPA: winged helix DNA-binding domain-containing protein [Pyrinomonadaceae bacterium]|nr:winged helix DNA-binding domain-containing protein [Pyrinomonadaceae bacterium]
MNKSPDLLEQRLHNQRLSSTEFEQPADVVRWMGAVQAQEFHAGKWALALRMREATSANIQEAYDRGQILRTHVMRPTWHFVTPEDIRWLLELTAARVNLRCGPNYRKYEVDDALFKKARRVLVKVLQGGRHVTRAELKAALNRAGIDASDTVRMAHVMLRAELDGLVCSGAMDGKQFTYALLDERVPASQTLSRDEALAELTKRYFSSHGPATMQDFVWWSGLTTTDARRGIELAGDQLTTLKLPEAVHWIGSLTPNRDTNHDQRPAIVRANLLPAFDEYNVAYKKRELPTLGPTVVVNGRTIGTWTATADHASVLIRVTSSQELNESQKRLLKKAAESYGSYIGSPARVAYGL